MENKITLREATMADIPVLMEIEESVAGSNMYHGIPDEAGWINKLSQSMVYLILNDGAVAGHIVCNLINESYAHLGSLIVKSGFRRRGIARAAMIFMIEKFRDTARVDFLVHPRNSAAIKLYLDLGFFIESWKDDYFGDGEPRITMARIKETK